MGDKVRRILAANLKIYRKAHGISQMELAERAGLSTSLIAAIETENKFPSSTSIMKLSDALSLEPYQLFIDIETWGRLAETCYEYLKKGRGVRVVGRLKQHRWETDGKFRSKIVIVAEHVEFKPDYKSNTRKSEEVESAYV